MSGVGFWTKEAVAAANAIRRLLFAPDRVCARCRRVYRSRWDELTCPACDLLKETSTPTREVSTRETRPAEEPSPRKRRRRLKRLELPFAATCSGREWVEDEKPPVMSGVAPTGRDGWYMEGGVTWVEVDGVAYDARPLPHQTTEQARARDVSSFKWNLRLREQEEEDVGVEVAAVLARVESRLPRRVRAAVLETIRAHRLVQDGRDVRRGVRVWLRRLDTRPVTERGGVE